MVHCREPSNAASATELPASGALDSYNYLADAVLSLPRTREMYMRRLRTLMDGFTDGKLEVCNGNVLGVPKNNQPCAIISRRVIICLIYSHFVSCVHRQSQRISTSKSGRKPLGTTRLGATLAIPTLDTSEFCISIMG